MQHLILSVDRQELHRQSRGLTWEVIRMGIVNHGRDLPLHWRSTEEAMREEAGYAPYFCSYGKKIDYATHLSPTVKDGEIRLWLSYQGHSSGSKTFPFSQEGFQEASQIIRKRFSHKEPVKDAELEEFWEAVQEWVEAQRSRYYEAMPMAEGL